jgi:ketosteroid isomerase-like protein
MKETEVAAQLIELERAAMKRWAVGDPGGFLELSGPEVTYFDPYEAKRVNGIEELRRLYEAMRGKVHLDSFDFLEPRVQVAGDMAVLSFQFVSVDIEGEMHWNTTEVYRLRQGRWSIVHTHWSFTQPKLAK